MTVVGLAIDWAETKGTGDLLGLWSIAAGAPVMGGLSVTYLLPFSDLSSHDALASASASAEQRPERPFARVMPTAQGLIHLHPAYQQREYVIGDGLHVLERSSSRAPGWTTPPSPAPSSRSRTARRISCASSW